MRLSLTYTLVALYPPSRESVTYTSHGRATVHVLVDEPDAAVRRPRRLRDDDRRAVSRPAHGAAGDDVSRHRHGAARRGRPVAADPPRRREPRGGRSRGRDAPAPPPTCPPRRSACRPRRECRRTRSSSAPIPPPRINGWCRSLRHPSGGGRRGTRRVDEAMSEDETPDHQRRARPDRRQTQLPLWYPRRLRGRRMAASPGLKSTTSPTWSTACRCPPSRWPPCYSC